MNLMRQESDTLGLISKDACNNFPLSPVSENFNRKIKIEKTHFSKISLVSGCLRGTLPFFKYSLNFRISSTSNSEKVVFPSKMSLTAFFPGFPNFLSSSELIRMGEGGDLPEGKNLQEVSCLILSTSCIFSRFLLFFAKFISLISRNNYIGVYKSRFCGNSAK